ncbi:MAG: hypothetical protein BKP49_09085 [Treponema sp. CETP13]|nr:MAG: hypothetical protein BKP49_09085 [Treponema sp. CETP13]
MGLFHKVNYLIYKDFGGFLNGAKRYSIQNPLYNNDVFFKKLGNKYSDCKAVLLINIKNSFSLFASFNVDKITEKKIVSSKDFWDGTFPFQNKLTEINSDELFQYRQLFGQTDNENFNKLFLERFFLNNNEYINLITCSDSSTINFDKIQRLNNDIKFLVKYLSC